MNKLSINDIYTSDYIGKLVQVEGWIAFIGNDLFLINMDYGHDYKLAKKIKILNKGIEDFLKRKVLLFGGGSMFFHEANLLGYIKNEPILGLSIDTNKFSVKNEAE